MKKIKYLLLSLALCITTSVFSQQRQKVKTKRLIHISGKVTGENGKSVPGVTVFVRGTTIGTITNTNGIYYLSKVPSNATLQFSFVGMQTKEVKVNSHSTINITMAESSTGLNEVVVIGYGTQRKGNITSSIATVKAKNFNPGAIQDAGQLIKGKVAGLVITNGSGNPNAVSNITLRGISTLMGNTAPLVLIDGVPGNITSVSPQDIKSINVLKDASAAAIYGTRGANGVILITTKSGQFNQKLTVNYSSYVTTSSFYKEYKFMTAQDIKDGYTDFTDEGYNTNWMDAISRPGFIQNHNINIRGGTNSAAYSVNLTYKDQNGVIKRTNSKDFLANFKANQYLFNRIVRLGFEDYLGKHYNNATTAQAGSWIYNVFRQAVIRNPTAPIYNKDGSYNENFNIYQYYNPVELINERKGGVWNTWNRFVGDITVEPIAGWQTKLMVTQENTSAKDEYYDTQKYWTSIVDGYHGDAYISNDYSLSNELDLTSSYKNSIGKHHFSAIVGYSYVYNEYDGNSLWNYDFPTDAFTYNNIYMGAALKNGEASLNSYKNDNKLISFFGRVTYNYSNKYHFTASLRHEGSSKFGADHKWGNFPAVSVGWTISNENFMKGLKWLNNLKLRAGYGVTGEIPTSSYLSLTLYNYGDYYYNDGTWVNGLQVASNPNPYLGWEKSGEIDIGLDFSVFNNRLGGSIDVYNKKTTGMLWNYNVPSPPNLYGTTLANVGEMGNKGIEVALHAIPIKTHTFQWSTTFTISHNSNKLLSLSNKLYQTNNYLDAGYLSDPISLPTHRLNVGYSLGNFWLLKSVGISSAGIWMIQNPKTGKAELFNNGMLNDNYFQYCGNGIPRIYLGWNDTFTYKGFELAMQWTGQFGFKILNVERVFYQNNSISYNKLQSARDLIYGKAKLSPNQEQVPVSYYLENGDFMKLDNLTLGYKFNMSKIKQIKSLQVYVTGQNLFCITGYSGLDPELTNSDFMAYGNDLRDKYPSIRSITCGINVTF